MTRDQKVILDVLPAVNPELLSVFGLVDELFEDSVVLAEQKEICVELKEASPITIVGDRVRLRQLFLNLVDNAIKYTPERGHVWMSIRREDGTAVFEVQDTGIGIPAAEQEKVFNRFYRVDKARSRERGGSGLGLSIAKWIAEFHRGSISVQSASEAAMADVQPKVR